MGREWRDRVYFHHTGYPGAFGGHCGAKWIMAWQLHSRDPTLVLWKACYNNLKGGLQRKTLMARLHIYPDDEVPEELMQNVSAQIRQIRPVPKRIDEFTQEEVENFPKVWEYPEEYIIK